jgi:hypothetical protein
MDAPSGTELQAGYIAAAVLMSANPHDRAKIIHLAKLFCDLSAPARTKFMQLLDSIKDDQLLDRAISFVGNKFPTDNNANDGNLILEDFSLNEEMFAAPMNHFPVLRGDEQECAENNGSPATDGPSRKRRRSKIHTDVLQLLPGEGSDMRQLRNAVFELGIDRLTTRALTLISAHFCIPVRGNKDKRAHRVMTFFEEWARIYGNGEESEGNSSVFLFTRERLNSCKDTIIHAINRTWKEKNAVAPRLESISQDSVNIEGDSLLANSLNLAFP